jgi:hypothetical protein
MIGAMTVGALMAALVVGVVVLVGKPVEPRPAVRWSALAITVLVSATLTPYTVNDSGAERTFILVVPVVAALLSVLAQRLGRLADVADLMAAVVIIASGLALGLGVGGGAFLPIAVLFAVSGASSLWRPLPTTG